MGGVGQVCRVVKEVDACRHRDARYGCDVAKVALGGWVARGVASTLGNEPPAANQHPGAIWCSGKSV